MVSTAAPDTAKLAPYALVKQFLKGGLAAGHWAPGALMPSKAALVAQFQVSRMTVNRALRELQADGLVQHHHRPAAAAVDTAPFRLLIDERPSAHPRPRP